MWRKLPPLYARKIYFICAIYVLTLYRLNPLTQEIIGSSLSKEIESKEEQYTTSTSWMSADLGNENIASSGKSEEEGQTQIQVAQQVSIPENEDITFARKERPKFQKWKGGIVLFYHVAKTGGSTIRSIFSNLQRHDRSTYTSIRYRDDGIYKNHSLIDKDGPGFDSCSMPLSSIQKIIRDTKNLLNNFERGSNKTYLWEIHGGTPGLDMMEPYIHEMREAMRAQNRSFFSFTVVREPIAYSKSYFKFYHNGCNKIYCEHRQYVEATESNLLSSVRSHRNQQCFLLNYATAIEGMHPSFYDQCYVSRNKCKNIYSTMKSTFDWVGTTERLSEDTIPILKHLLDYSANTTSSSSSDDVEADLKRQNDPFVVKREKMSQDHPFQYVSNSTISKLSNMTSFDREIFDQVRSDYVLADLFPELVRLL